MYQVREGVPGEGGRVDQVREGVPGERAEHDQRMVFGYVTVPSHDGGAVCCVGGGVSAEGGDNPAV